MPNVTAVLVNYRRPDNLTRILTRLKAQRETPELMLVNNAGFRTFGVERFVGIPWNAGPMARVALSQWADTEWVMWLDDDLIPTDDDFVGDLLEVARHRPDGITGVFGVALAQPPHYYSRGAQVAGHVHICKGRCLMFRRDILRHVSLGAHRSPVDYRMHDDIWLSLSTGYLKRTHWAVPEFRQRLAELPDPHAICDRPDHYPERDALCGWFLEQDAMNKALAAALRIPGQTGPSELELLWGAARQAPRGKRIVELGTFKGRSAALLWAAGRTTGAELTTIDRYSYESPELGGSDPVRVANNLQAVGVDPLPHIVEGESDVVPQYVEDVGMLFVDSDHRPEALQRELAVWEPILADGAVVALHDYAWEDRFPGMTAFIDAYFADWERIGAVGHMVAFRRGAP